MLEYSFMQYAFLGGTIIAVVCGVVSYFVIVRRTAFAAHALGHISMTGAAASLLLGLPAMLGLLVINIFSSIIMGLMGEKIKKNDLVIGLVLTFFLGLGAYFLYLYQTGYAGGVMSILFGNILAISPEQILVLLILGAIVLISLIIISRPLLYASFDPVSAASKKIPLRRLAILFFVILAVTVSMACQIVGALLVFSLLIGPGAIASQWCDGFYSSILISVCASVLTVWISLTLSFYCNLPASFCITMIICIIYGCGALKKYLL